MTDVYALGVLTFELVTGNPPYSIEYTSSSKIKDEILNSDLNLDCEHISTDLKDLLQKMLQKNPETRCCYGEDISSLLLHK